MFKKTVVIEKSKIIREGLTALLYAHELSSKVVCMEDFGEWNLLIKNTTPDLMIVSPEAMYEGKDKIRNKYKLGDEVPFMGLVYQYYNHKEMTDLFNEVIFITDSEEVIVNKFRNLSSQTTDQMSSSNEKLTDREKDVLKLLLRGLANKEVADQLFISPHTVVSHRKNIIEKTGIKSLSGLAVYAILNNIADMEDLKQ